MAKSNPPVPVRRLVLLQPVQDLGQSPLDRKALVEVLGRIDSNLASPGTICLIGSAATILLGQVARQTEDIDVWAQASRVCLTELGPAAEAAGLSYDPKEEFPRLPYLQIVHPGIVHVPGWNPELRQWLGEPEREVWKGTKLTVTVPPPRVIVASKLVRGDDRDLQDCIWLMAAHGVAAQDLAQVIKALPGGARRSAADNLELLGLLKP